jgi:nucleoside-diphosphate-sugar epimerase
MKIVVIGGTGLIGSKTVAILRQDGHKVVAASPLSGINTVTDEGLKEAMVDTTVVIDLANSPSDEDKTVMEFFETSGRNLLAPRSQRASNAMSRSLSSEPTGSPTTATTVPR